MRDLQHRLVALGHDAGADDPGAFGPATTAALRSLQRDRGLEVSGVCDVTTWDALVEAGWSLGDRPLYRAATASLLRGDDVADLQRRLNAIGFDAGRVDGIFGVRTEAALLDFQRNAGLVADCICGPATVGALQRLGDRPAASDSVVDVRERERYRCLPRTLAGRRIVVAHRGGLDALASSVTRLLAAGGASALVVEHPDGSEQAAQANHLEADVFLGIGVGPSPPPLPDTAVLEHDQGCRIAYYRAPNGWASQGGLLLADLLSHEVRVAIPSLTTAVSAMSVPLLRETRMPAVLVELWPPETAVVSTGAIAACVVPALEAWIQRVGAD